MLHRHPKSKFSKKEKYITTELSSLSENPKSVGIGLKVVKIYCPTFYGQTHVHADIQTFLDSSLTKVENKNIK